MDPRIALRERAMRPVQYGIVLICVLINLIDGYDILALAQAAPHLAADWQLAPEELGLLFSMGWGRWWCPRWQTAMGGARLSWAVWR